MQNRNGFTLIEVLISIALLGLMIVPLFSVIEMMQHSNETLLRSLDKSKVITKATKVMFMDILGSDGTLEIIKDNMTRLCIEETTNSLYNLPTAKVCWVVLKDKNTLTRVEGNFYKLPLKSEDKVEVNTIMTSIEIFDVYQKKDKVIVFIKQKDKEPISFMLQGIINPVLEVMADGTKKMRNGNKILRDGTTVFKDGSKLLPNGTIVPSPQKKKNNIKGNKKQKSGGFNFNKNSKGRAENGLSGEHEYNKNENENENKNPNLIYREPGETRE